MSHTLLYNVRHNKKHKERNMNDARLTMRLPGEYLTFARNYAREREMTLTDLVVGYFKRLKESLSVKNQLPPSVSDMVGIIPSDKDNPIDEYHDHLMERYA